MRTNIKRVTTLFFMTVIFFFSAHAGTLEQIAQLEKSKDALPVKSLNTLSTPNKKSLQRPVWFELSNGKRIDIQRWQIIHFISSECPYCHQFNPTLKQVSERIGMDVFVYSFDGAGDVVFPSVLPATQQVINDFFPELPKVTPTDFIVHKDTLVAIPLSQGAISEQVLIQRLEETFTLAERMGVL